MKLRIILTNEGEKKPQSVEVEVASEMDAQIKWVDYLVRGIFLPSKRMFIPPHRIAEARIEDSKGKSEPNS